MKLLFDQNLSFRLCEDVEEFCPGSQHVRMIGLSSADDRAIWQYAQANGYTIVSQDVDFAEMAVLLGSPPKVIWVRTGNRPRSAIGSLLRLHAALITSFEHDKAVCLEVY